MYLNDQGLKYLSTQIPMYGTQLDLYPNSHKSKYSGTEIPMYQSTQLLKHQQYVLKETQLLVIWNRVSLDYMMDYFY